MSGQEYADTIASELVARAEDLRRRYEQAGVGKCGWLALAMDDMEKDQRNDQKVVGLRLELSEEERRSQSFLRWSRIFFALLTFACILFLSRL